MRTLEGASMMLITTAVVLMLVALPVGLSLSSSVISNNNISTSPFTVEDKVIVSNGKGGYRIQDNNNDSNIVPLTEEGEYDIKIKVNCALYFYINIEYQSGKGKAEIAVKIGTYEMSLKPLGSGSLNFYPGELGGTESTPPESDDSKWFYVNNSTFDINVDVNKSEGINSLKVTIYPMTEIPSNKNPSDDTDT